MSRKRQKTQLELAFARRAEGEARSDPRKGSNCSWRRANPNAPSSSKFQPNPMSNRIAVYGPVRTVVWEGGGREAPPYPDLQDQAPRRRSFKMDQRTRSQSTNFELPESGRTVHPHSTGATRAVRALGLTRVSRPQ